VADRVEGARLDAKITGLLQKLPFRASFTRRGFRAAHIDFGPPTIDFGPPTMFAMLVPLIVTSHAPSSVRHAEMSIERRHRRWNDAVRTLADSTADRRRRDHRAHLARLVGVYVAKEVPGALSDEAELLLAMQPDQGGRKLLFLDAADGSTLGFIELETLSAAAAADAVKVAHADASDASTSVLRGMLVAEGCRGRGYARLFLALWLTLCSRAGVTPATSRINKPLLALTLVRLGFTPLRGRHTPGCATRRTHHACA
jgi:GNAT superfamily N-acetyltransferase